MNKKSENQLKDQKNNAGGNNGKRPSRAKGFIGFAIYIAVLLLLVFLFVQFIAIQTKVIGSSMESTLSEGDRVIVDKISYRFKDPERFDVIVFPYEDAEGQHYYMKRIIGLPGETVLIDEAGVIYIDGKALAEDFGNAVISADRLGLAAAEITLAEDEYFVLGDNRNNSSDSRDADVGNVRREEIVGRVWIRIYPFNQFGTVRQ